MLAFRLVIQPRFPFVARRYAYTGRQKMLQALGPDLSRSVTMTADDSVPEETSIGRIFEGTHDVHKLRHYLPIYERVLTNAGKMLEIGVDRGGSLEMWRQYLPRQPSSESTSIPGRRSTTILTGVSTCASAIRPTPTSCRRFSTSLVPSTRCWTTVGTLRSR